MEKVEILFYKSEEDFVFRNTTAVAAKVTYYDLFLEFDLYVGMMPLITVVSAQTAIPYSVISRIQKTDGLDSRPQIEIGLHADRNKMFQAVTARFISMNPQYSDNQYSMRGELRNAFRIFVRDGVIDRDQYYAKAFTTASSAGEKESGFAIVFSTLLKAIAAFKSRDDIAIPDHKFICELFMRFLARVSRDGLALDPEFSKCITVLPVVMLKEFHDC